MKLEYFIVNIQPAGKHGGNIQTFAAAAVFKVGISARAEQSLPVFVGKIGGNKLLLRHPQLSA